jgi:hypothetical protein
MMQLAAAEELTRRGELYPSVILHGAAESERQAAALRLARLLLCEAVADLRPCGQCRHCLRISWPGSEQDSFHPDFRVLERDLKTSISVEATKSFLQLAQVAPFEAAGQVFVIASAESLTGEAANALLKTLEEPPSRTPRNFFLLTPSQLDLLPTIRSRSLPIYLGAGDGVDGDRADDLARQFAASIESFVESGSTLHLIMAAENLASAGGWQDPRAAEPWTLAAAAVKNSLVLVPSAEPQRLLALAEDLLTGWRLRLRGIQAQRILEGMVVRHIAR